MLSVLHTNGENEHCRFEVTLEGRPTQLQIGNLEATIVTYDDLRRVTLVGRGSGGAARIRVGAKRRSGFPGWLAKAAGTSAMRRTPLGQDAFPQRRIRACQVDEIERQQGRRFRQLARPAAGA